MLLLFSRHLPDETLASDCEDTDFSDYVAETSALNMLIPQADIATR